ncbi:hypothetical protein D3C81_1562750 [compost metagenome]
MGRGEAIEQRLQRFRQCLEGRDAAAPQGIAAIRRHLLGGQHGAEGRGFQEGHVGVPDGVIAHVGHGCIEDDHLALLRHAGVDRVDMQIAEARGEGSLLLRL